MLMVNLSNNILPTTHMQTNWHWIKSALKGLTNTSQLKVALQIWHADMQVCIHSRLTDTAVQCTGVLRSEVPNATLQSMKIQV